MIFGCKKSHIDGSESDFKAPQSARLPLAYSSIKFLPKALNQGLKPICVPCSISAYINWFINVNNGGKKNDNNVKLMEIFKGDENGMSIKDALKILKEDGVTTDNGKFKIKQYARIGNERALKVALVMNGPCIGALGVYNSNENSFWIKDGSKFEGGHAIAIVGYDEKGFIIRNSWGEEYGKNGYWHLPYEDLNLFYEIWTII